MEKYENVVQYIYSGCVTDESGVTLEISSNSFLVLIDHRDIDS